MTLTRADRARLKRQKSRLRRGPESSAGQAEEQFAARVSAAAARAEARQTAEVKLEFPAELPISEHRVNIVSLLRENQVIVVCGETGSGKSTQLPKMCVEAGFGRDGMIGHTQPRRLAARSIAARLAEETGTILGNEIGYQVRFGDKTSDRTLIKLMTDGILLAETGSDPDLLAYDVIIIDEAHERSLNIDFLLGLLRRIMDRRPELRIIITSATIDAERFAEHFGKPDSETGEIIPAPILQVEGRGYPVELRYFPWEDVNSGASRGYDLSMHVTAAIDLLRRDGSGDTLVFLPTERDIREVSHVVAGHFKRAGLENRVELLPLYARLPQSAQQAIFHPTGGKQRIIFATNVAESSLTVPGIRYVIDSGTARISRYSVRSKVQRLPVEPVSRASANQRSGRCGRIGPGIAVRLYDVEDFESRDAFTTPEIRRTNLASVVLQSKVLRLGRLEDFPLIDPPRVDAIREGFRTLAELGAVDADGELTEIGWQLGRMPVDPRVGRILIAAEQHGVLPEVLPIAAAMEIPDPRDRPPDKRAAADQAHAQFADPESDFLNLLRIWRFYDEMSSKYGRGKMTRVLRQNFLSPNRMREWSDVYRQLKEMAATNLGALDPVNDRAVQKDKREKNRQRDSRKGRQRGRLHIGPIRYSDTEPAHGDDIAPIVDEDRYAQIHQALLTGLLSGVAMAGEKNEYTGAGGLKLFLWPGSGVFEAKPKWIVAAELVETAKQYARTVAKIQPSWIEAVGDHMLKSSFSDPHWSRKASGAFCYQRRSLFGLPVVLRRRVPLAPIDAIEARNLLIRNGLVGGELPTTAKFVRHNRALLESIEKLAAKTRRRDLVVDDYVLQAFYQSRLPDWACDRARLEKFDRACQVPDWAGRLKDDVDLATWLADPPSPSVEDEVPDAAPGDSEGTPYLRPEDLLETTASKIDNEDFPDELASGATRLPLEYHFRPGTEDDGIHLTIHPAALPQVSDEALDWLVPGQLETKVIAMIKSLPKRLRRLLIPAADVAKKVTEEIASKRGQSAFMPTLCEALTRHAETRISPDDFQEDKLEQHLRFLVRVVDDEGKVLALDRSVDSIKQKLGSVSEATDVSSEESSSEDDWSREKMTAWDIERLPKEVIRKRGGVQVAQFPGLVDRGDFVSTRLFADATIAESNSRLGLARLFSIACRKDLRAQVRHLPKLADAKLKLGPIVSAGVIESSLADLLARLAVVEKRPIVRSPDEFAARLAEAPARIGEATQDVATWLTKLTDAYHAARVAREEMTSNKFADVVADVDLQMQWLFADGFLSWTPWQHLQHVPRYLNAIAYRLDKVRSGGEQRDAESRQVVGSLWDRWLASRHPDEQNPRANADSEFRWLIEELRVSQFAQPLGTAVKVSPKRCEKLLI
ncbi:ATP-dependent RNA helicase HrpA [Rhodopirellula sp. ICT_H3.1]|uniref:ATP-dependent RNA helicase HrpA n=1 Tax=Aporhodopirellula aestuarii TaxID=2950107 RepID=A0ABT0U9C4_9BACT|nr:ATP-dependent RNA helicase HrpA [Aporhodopirellula aestuarii]MCM2373488.1 ATP-dependent RNA helicase HrpA [Aporhodopirellula aestuarii]